MWLIFAFATFFYAATHTFDCDHTGYWYYLISSWIGPNESEGLTAAGYSGSIEYRGYTPFALSGWPGPGTTITSLVLGLCNNTGGTGLTININRPPSEYPTANQCGVSPPIYLTNQPVNSGVDQYTFFDLTGTQAKDDFSNAWESGASYFCLGYSGSGPMHFFYGMWAWGDVKAVLIVNYTIGVEEKNKAEMAKTETAELEVYPNPFHNFVNLKFQIPNSNPETNSGQTNSKSQITINIYNVVGSLVKSFSLPTTYSILPTISVEWDGTDDFGRKLPPGIYFVKVETRDFREIKKVVKIE